MCGWVGATAEVDVIEEISPEEKNIRVDAQTFFSSLGEPPENDDTSDEQSCCST